MSKPKVVDAEVVAAEEGLEKVETGQVQSLIPMPSINIEALMEKALIQNASMETIERLVALSERMRAQWAKQRFTQAHAKFQAECGSIVKTHPVFRKTATPQQRKAFYQSGDMEGVQYMYAPLEDILEEATPHLSRNGLSHSFKSEIDSDKMTLKAICFLRHVDGHVEPEDPKDPDSGFTVPIGAEYMSKQQMFGSAMSFAKRYAFLNATGLQPTGEDGDGQDEKKRKGAGGDDHKFKQPQSKSERKEQRGSEKEGPTGETGQAAAKFPDIKRAANDSRQIMKSTLGTLQATMKRVRISEGTFAKEFGFPLEQLDKEGLNSTLDWIKEHE